MNRIGLLVLPFCFVAAILIIRKIVKKRVVHRVLLENGFTQVWEDGRLIMLESPTTLLYERKFVGDTSKNIDLAAIVSDIQQYPADNNAAISPAPGE